MQTRLFVLLGTGSVLTGQPYAAEETIRTVLHEDSGWVRVDSLKTGQEIFNKTIDPSTVPAIMVTQKAPVTPETLAETIEDVDRYADFIHDAYLDRSDLLSRTPTGMDGYQFLRLPFIVNRHYIYRMVRQMNTDSGTIRFDWSLLPRDSQYADFLDSMDVLYGNPVYPHAVAGSWEIVPVSESEVRLTYRLYSDPAGLVPGFLVARANRIVAPAMVREMVAEAARREAP
ncbi:MAG: hypothetical protein ACE5HZ_01950 [Fidelibacterota bacterium]